MAITCYYVGGSPFAWRALLALGYKGLEYEAKELHFSKGDTQTDEYLALNPRGKVPVLTDGDVTVYESLAVLAYLERAYPQKPLFGDTPAEAGRIWQRTLEIENYFGVAVPKVARPIFTGQIEGNEDQIRENLEILQKEIGTIESWLKTSDYLAGDSVSAADLTAYPALALVERVLGSRSIDGIDVGFLPYADVVPAVRAWMDRIEAIDGFEAAYPPHWRQKAA